MHVTPNGSAPVVLMDVTAEVDRGITYKGTVVADPAENKEAIGIRQCSRFPPPNLVTHPLASYTIHPSQRVALLIFVTPGLEETTARIRRVRVHYMSEGATWFQDFSVPYEVEITSKAPPGKCRFA